MSTMHGKFCCWVFEAQYYWNLDFTGRSLDGEEKSKQENLIVVRKTKAYIKSHASDAIGALNDAIYGIIDAAIARTQANRRNTVKPQGL